MFYCVRRCKTDKVNRKCNQANVFLRTCKRFISKNVLKSIRKTFIFDKQQLNNCNSLYNEISMLKYLFLLLL